MSDAHSLWMPLALMIVSGPLEVRAGAPVYHVHEFANLAEAACPIGAPGNAPDGTPWGISLAGVRGWAVTVKPLEEGATLTGAGSLNVCVYVPNPWGPGEWVLSPRFTWTMTATDTTTANHPAIRFEDTPVYVGLSDRVFVYPSTDFGVSSGGVTIYLEGERW